jgi:hypothetical protein
MYCRELFEVSGEDGEVGCEVLDLLLTDPQVIHTLSKKVEGTGRIIEILRSSAQ